MLELCVAVVAKTSGTVPSEKQIILSQDTLHILRRAVTKNARNSPLEILIVIIPSWNGYASLGMVCIGVTNSLRCRSRNKASWTILHAHPVSHNQERAITPYTGIPVIKVIQRDPILSRNPITGVVLHHQVEPDAECYHSRLVGGWCRDDDPNFCWSGYIGRDRRLCKTKCQRLLALAHKSGTHSIRESSLLTKVRSTATVGCEASI
jgi:hypothetical protein